MTKQTSSKSKSSIKLRHSTGAYLHMNDAPTEEDIIFFLGTQKHKTAEITQIVKAFGEHKADTVEAVLRVLAVKNIISRVGVTNEKNVITLV